ncbi:tail fiber protein [Salmonella enterica]|nr:tail fiber protein [Salmonella enterica]
MGDGSALPVGVPVPWPLPTPPLGWLKYNGAPFDKNLYPKLALVYPGGVLPDLRGEFIRGWDDGRGLNMWRILLSNELDSAPNIQGRLGNVEDTAIFENATPSAGSFIHTGGFNRYPKLAAIEQATPPVSGYSRWIELDASVSSQAYGRSNEVRPRNVAFNYIVRAA